MRTSKSHTRLIAGLLLALLSQHLAGLPAMAAMVPVEEMRVISTAPDGSLANNFSTYPSISTNGEKIAFTSAASNLVNGDSNQVSDIFLHTTRSSVTESLSHSPQGEVSNGASFEPAIAGDGNVVAFTSLASNLVAVDTNGVADIYLRDFATGTTERVSITSDGIQPDGWSDQPSVSGDGRFVVFRSAAGNLDPSDRNNADDVYLFDRRHKALRRISDTGQDASHPVISLDGRTIFYISHSPDGDQLINYNRLLGEAEKIDVSGWKLPSGYTFGQPALSADGRYLAVPAANQRITTYYLLDTTTQEIRTVTTQKSAGAPVSDPGGVTLSMDGRWMAYPSKTGLTILDLERGSADNLQPIQSPALSNAHSPAITVTQDGLRLTFSSLDSGIENIYLADLALEMGPTRLMTGWVSDATGYPLGNVAISDGTNYLAYTEPDGRFAFEGYINRNYQLSAEKKGFSFSPSRLAVRVSLSGEYGIEYSGSPVDVIEEARLDIGMPYSLHRGCESPYQGCNGPYHGFYSGDCTDLVMDAYMAGADFNIQLSLERDVFNNPRHYYRWRDVRNSHDMWRYFGYTGQLFTPEQAYLPGDVVFFDWENDGVIDHVALISEVNSRGRPRKMIDATGIITDNPSGLATEMTWKPYHTTRTPGHARWNGFTRGQKSTLAADIPILLVALDAPGVSLRLLDPRGRAISADEAQIPGGHFTNTGLGKLISIDHPIPGDDWYFIEIYSDKPAPYQLGIQVIESRGIKAAANYQRQLAAGETQLIPLKITRVDNQLKFELPTALP